MRIRSGLMLVMLAVVSLLFATAPQSDAAIRSKYYPNGYYGPYYMSITTRMLNPGSGSQWAYGMLNTCTVPHLGLNTWYGSTSNGSTDPLAGSATLTINYSNGGFSYIDYGNFN